MTGKIEYPTCSIEGDNMIAYCDVRDAFTYRFYLWKKHVRNVG